MRQELLRLRRAFHAVRPQSTTLSVAGALGFAALSLPVMLGSIGPSASTSPRTHLAATAHSAAPSAPTLQSNIVANVTLADQKSGSGESVQQMIDQAFGPYAWQALAVARCELGYVPSATNPSSGAAGVFQFMWTTWEGTSYAGYSPYNAWANVNAAHQVFVRDGYSWREWTCQP